jgi:UDP:flavonoid glycosyltransferase YjiC (YdhE family)
MANFLFAWELGDGLGHVGRILPIAQALRSKGHQIFFAAKDVTRVTQFDGSESLTLMQAPIWMHRLYGVPSPMSYAEIMLRAGFWDELSLTGLTQAWRSLYFLSRADVVVCEHAPCALFAAKVQGLKTVVMGNGFMCPPDVDLLPAFVGAEAAPLDRLRSAQARVMRTVQVTTTRLGVAPILLLGDVLRPNETMLTTWSELDPYPRVNPRYFGPIAQISHGAEPAWNGEASGKKVLAYLKAESPEIEPTLLALSQCGANVLLYCPGLSPELLGKHKSSRLVFSSVPVSIAQAIHQADLVVSHGGDSVVSAALHGGTAQWIVPTHSEQLGTARAVEKLGAGLMSFPAQVRSMGLNQLKKILSDSSFGEQARAFAHKYAEFDFTTAPERASDFLEGLLRNDR